MAMRSLLACLVLVASLAAAERAAAESRTGAAPPERRSKDVSAAAKPKQRLAPAPGRSGSAPRRLEDIHIEGEIPVPQVLFVTARDQRRLTPFHHRRYLKTSAQLGEETPLPSRVEIVRSPTAKGAPRATERAEGAARPR